MTWARTLNREFAVTLSDSEVRGIWRSVCRYRARWRVQGHQQGWLWKQAARGRKGGAASGVVRRAGTPLEHDRAPWADLGVSRATWYRRFRAAKVDGESLVAKGETEANTDRSAAEGQDSERSLYVKASVASAAASRSSCGGSVSTAPAAISTPGSATR